METKSERFELRLTPSESLAVRKAAKKQGVTMAELICTWIHYHAMPKPHLPRCRSEFRSTGAF